MKKRVPGLFIFIFTLLLGLPGCGGGGSDSSGDTVYITASNTTSLSVASYVDDPSITVHNFTVTSTAYPGSTNPSPVKVMSVDVSYASLTYNGVDLSPPLSVIYSQVTQPKIINAGGSANIEVGVVDTVAKVYLNGPTAEAVNIRSKLAELNGVPLKYTANITVHAVELNTNRNLIATTTCEVYLSANAPVVVP